MDVTLAAALAGENEDFLHSAVGDDLHLFFNLLHGQLHAVDVVIAVKPTVHAVVFTVIGNVQRGKQIHRVAKMLAGLPSGADAAGGADGTAEAGNI